MQLDATQFKSRNYFHMSERYDIIYVFLMISDCMRIMMMIVTRIPIKAAERQHPLGSWARKRCLELHFF